jgi:GNAT superfamily N-acetyltransferase
MPGILTLQQIIASPDLATTRIERNGKEFLLRPLGAGDADLLAEYFANLSDRTRSWYAPHEFTRAVADAFCKDLLSANTLRLIAVTGDAPPEIAAYFIVQLGLRPPEHERFEAHGMPLTDADACSLAPSVADAFQNAGLGGAVLRHAITVARRMGRSRMILFGGVGLTNPRAVHFYQKHGFRRVPADAPDDRKFDMVLDMTAKE